MYFHNGYTELSNDVILIILNQSNSTCYKTTYQFLNNF